MANEGKSDRTENTRTIGLVCADSSDIFLAKAVYFIERLLRSNDYNSILCCSGYELTNKESSLQLLCNQQVDGIILIGSSYVYDRDTDNTYIRDTALSVPVMLLNAVLDNPNVYSVVTDDFTSMYEATNKMIASGVEDILYFYNSVSYSGRQKLAGYLKAMEDHQLKPLREFYSGSNEDIPAMTDCLNRYDAFNSTGNEYSFHGVIAAEDALALAAVKYAIENCRFVPDDLSVIGCNNSLLANCCEPELTSIDNKLENMCHALVDTLMGVLAGKEMPQQTVISGELVIRGTTML